MTTINFEREPSSSGFTVESVSSPATVVFFISSLDQLKDRLHKIMDFIAPGNKTICSQIALVTRSIQIFRWKRVEEQDVYTSVTIHPVQNGMGFVLQLHKEFADETNFVDAIADLIELAPIGRIVFTKLLGQVEQLDNLLKQHGSLDQVTKNLEFRARQKLFNRALKLLKNFSQEKALPDIFSSTYNQLDRVLQRELLDILKNQLNFFFNHDDPGLSAEEEYWFTSGIEFAIVTLAQLADQGRIKATDSQANPLSQVYTRTLESFFTTPEQDQRIQKIILYVMLGFLSNKKGKQVEKLFSSTRLDLGTLEVQPSDLVLHLINDDPKVPNSELRYKIERRASINLRNLKVDLLEYRNYELSVEPSEFNTSFDQDSMIGILSNLTGVPINLLRSLYQKSLSREFVSPNPRIKSITDLQLGGSTWSNN